MSDRSRCEDTRVGQPHTPGDLFFENYYALNGYDPERGVNWCKRFGVNIDKDPDYMTARVGDHAIMEVKTFETRRIRDELIARRGALTTGIGLPPRGA